MSTPNTKPCPRCGFSNAINANYCGQCRNRFDSTGANDLTVSPNFYSPTQSALPPQSAKHRKKKIKWNIIATIIVALIGLAGILINKYGLPTIPPSKNLIKDGGFDTVIIYCTNKSWNSGMTNWCTDDTRNIGIDKNNHGSGETPATSARLVSNTREGTDTHLFAPAIYVRYGKTYKITYHLKLINIKGRGVFVPYIDEFDEKGTDLKTGGYQKGAQRSSPTEETVTISYTPSLRQVASTRFYFIVVDNSDTVAYVDDVTWEETNG